MMTEKANTGAEPIGDGVPLNEPTFDPAAGWMRKEDLPEPELESDDETDGVDNASERGERDVESECEAEEVEAGNTEEGEVAKDGVDGDAEGEGGDAEEVEGELLDAGSLENTFVEVAGGKVPVAELARGYLRQSDYTRKTQELAEQRRELGQQAEEVQRLLVGLATVMQQALPPAPDPGLAQTDPEEYVRQKAAYDAAQQQMQAFLQMAEQAQQIAVSATQLDPEVEAERLLERAPELQDPNMREQWFAEAEQAARELGFLPEEIEQVADHRLWLLAHYAAKGMQLDKRQREMKSGNAERKVRTRKPRGKARKEAQRKLRQNRAALERLRQTGSIDDAVAVGFSLPGLDE